MSDTVKQTQRLAQRYAHWLQHSWPWVIGAAIVVCAISGGLASRLQLRTDFAELLPSGDPSIQELRRVQARLPGNEALIVNISGEDHAANTRFADALVAKVRTYSTDLVSLAQTHINKERAWFAERQGLYMEYEDLEKLRDALRREIGANHNPFFVSLDADDHAPQAEPLDHILKRLQADEAASLGPGLSSRFPDGYFGTADGKTVSVVILPPGGQFREHAGETLREHVLATVAELSPTSFGVREVGYSGDIESNIEERNALEDDLVYATSICVALVCLSIWVYFGRLKVLMLLGWPALLGTLVAYGVAELAFGYLNSSTAFLASIIVGNGINFAIIQMSRYEEERRHGAPVLEALSISIANTVRATGIAAFAATLSYGSLTLTQFRGFSQFGIIGGTGMLAAWFATIFVLPAVVWVVDRNLPILNKGAPERGQHVSSVLARLAVGSPTVLVSLGLAASIVSIAVLPNYLRDPFEYNFRNLRSAVSDDTSRGESRWLKANAETFGRALNPLVVLLHETSEIDVTRDALLKVDRERGAMLERVVAVQDLIPGSVKEQQAKLPLLAEIRAILTGPDAKSMGAALRKKILPFIPPANLQPVRATDLPALVRHPFTEVDGTLGNVLLLFPKMEGYNSWDGRDMLNLSDRVAEIALPDGNIERAVGGPVIFAGMLRSILHDGPVATLASMIGVILLVTTVLRRGISASLLLLGTLAAGMLWMLGGAALLGIRVNFLNFVAIPVTLGIGIDYGINILMRAQLEGPRNLQQAVRATGGAVVLCSATTIIGYGALLVADNRGLRSFGTLAILGEIACLTAALVIMPAWLTLGDRLYVHRHSTK